MQIVERGQQVKGLEMGIGDYIMIDPDEVAVVVPDSDKMLEAETFISCFEKSASIPSTRIPETG
jgi:DNA end-binding protein Ku